MSEVAVLIGLQSSGKTTFYRDCLATSHETPPSSGCGTRGWTTGSTGS